MSSPIYRVIAAALVTTAVLASAGPASARSSDGAQVLNVNACHDFGDGVTICEDIHGVFNVTETPSGNTSILMNAFGDTTFIGPGPGCNQSSASQRSRQHFLLKDGVVHEEFLAFRGFFTTPACPGPLERCEFSTFFHLVGDEIQFLRLEFDCTPLP